MQITSFHEPVTGTWTHLLADPATLNAAIIDPVWEFDPVSGATNTAFIENVLREAEERQYRIEWVLETHAHADHLTAADQVRKRTGAQIACSRGILEVRKNFSRVFGSHDAGPSEIPFDRLLSEGDEIELGQLRIRVMETPGHTSDSLTYLVADAAFVGDTLFAPAAGTARCDFPGGDAGTLFDSISRIHELPPETRIFLCHDYPGEGQAPVRDFTVAESREQNIHANARTRRQDYVAMRQERDATLGLPRLILPSLQVNIRAGAAPEPDANGVPYLRTPFNRSIAELIQGGSAAKAGD
ncbi:MAG: MBL fold metallo-hydrolase [Lysobacterales bacterium]|jgi:glyoxylase-like metal-dependent hydrolase (beta-lactamase superfamily II)